MTMDKLDIPEEFKIDIERIQNELKNGIRNHQCIYLKLKEDPDNTDLQKSLLECQQKLIVVGLDQKTLLERIRKEYRNFQKTSRKNAARNGIEDRRGAVNNSLSRARKQNIAARPTSVASTTSEESEDVSERSSPEPFLYPIIPNDLSQKQFLHYFKLCSHQDFKDLTNRKIERKRRSTTNPHFIYTREWNATNHNSYAMHKRKRISPPTTRAAKKKASPPQKAKSRSASPVMNDKKPTALFPAIPNLPSGLTIERITSPKVVDKTKCNECNLPGNLLECEVCKNGYHASCHTKSSVLSPKLCPQCESNKDRGLLGATNGELSVTCITAEVSEKLQERQLLLEKHKDLAAELTQLQDKHSQLTISLKNQDCQKEELLVTQQSTEDKIKKILNFISTVKAPMQIGELNVSV